MGAAVIRAIASEGYLGSGAQSESAVERSP